MVRSLAAVSLTVGAALAINASGVGADAPPRPASEQPTTVSEAANLPSAIAPSADGIDMTLLRLREGTRLNESLGHFRLNGDVLTFIQDDNRELIGLANLNLERILRMLKTVDEPESVMWSVNGTVTEFSGRNYVLVTRAVYKAATPSPPEAIEETKTGPPATTVETLPTTPAPPAPAAAAPAPVEHLP